MSTHLYTAPVSAQTLHPELLIENNLVVASYDLFEEEEKVEVDDLDIIGHNRDSDYFMVWKLYKKQ